MIVAVLLVVINGLLATVVYRQRQQLRALQQSFEEVLAFNSKYALEQSALVNADLRFAKQVADINRQLVSMENQLQALETKRNNDGGYQHALRILEMGGNKEEIVQSCHLSNAEAELLMNLHAYRAVIKATP